MKAPPLIWDLTRVLEEGILPHADEVVRILDDGDIASLFFEIGDAFTDLVRPLGWTGRSIGVVPMSQTGARSFADRLASAMPADPRRARLLSGIIAWFRRPHGPRMFVMYDGRHICLDLDRGTGLWSIAPGTIDDRVRVLPRGLDPASGSEMVRLAAKHGVLATYRINEFYNVELIPIRADADDGPTLH